MVREETVRVTIDASHSEERREGEQRERTEAGA
jgi:hypothetical protein